MIFGSEQNKRNLIVAWARERFIKTGITNNITEACRLLLDTGLPGSENFPFKITTREKDRPKTILDKYVRPVCPDCGEPLFLQEKCSGMGGGDRITIWICKKCDYKEYSEKTLQEWLAELPLKTPEGLQNVDH